jgi:hypothetical protein
MPNARLNYERHKNKRDKKFGNLTKIVDRWMSYYEENF